VKEPKLSAGLLLFRTHPEVQVLLVHPGGPFWMKKDLGAWSIPKGLVEPTEGPLSAAIREVWEETGIKAVGPFKELGTTQLKSRKVIQAWSCRHESGEPMLGKSNTFTCEWPPRSGKIQEFPEVDQCRFFLLDEAKLKINPAQITFLDRFQQTLLHKLR